MKYYLLLLILIANSCTQSTEDMLTSAIRRNYKNVFKKHNEDLQRLDVKIIRYEKADSAYYFLLRLRSYMEDLKTMADLVNTAEKIPNYPKLKEYLAEQNRDDSIVQFIQTLSNKKGQPENLFFVKYHIAYKTPDRSEDGIDSSFMHSPDLEDVLVNLDSLFSHRNSR